MKHKPELTLKVRKHFLLVVFALLVTAALIFQGVYDWYQRNSPLNGEALISSLINNAVDNLNAPAPVDAKTGQVYFPDAKLMLPAPPKQNIGLRQIEYLNSSQGSTFELQITSAGVMNQAKNNLLIAQANAQGKHEDDNNVMTAIFNKVPDLQACSRGVQMFYSPKTSTNSALVLKFTKKLTSGKTIYAYNEPVCKAYDMSTLVNYLKKIQSY